MSESQKRKAERIVELLIANGNLLRIDKDLYGKAHSKEAWIKVLTEAIAKYEYVERARTKELTEYIKARSDEMWKRLEAEEKTESIIPRKRKAKTHSEELNGK